MSQAYRAPMRSRRDDVDHALAVERALRRGLVGVGEPTEHRAEARLERFHALPEDTFVWTRDAEGLHLGRISGPVHVDDSPDALAADLVHVRPCTWLEQPVDPALVPPQVTHAFERGGRNLQRIGTPGAAEATLAAWQASR